MDLYFQGAEQPVYQRQLIAGGATHVAVSFWEWQHRHTTQDIFQVISPELSVCVMSGAAKKEIHDWDSFADDYIEFCEHNAGQVLIYDMDAPDCPLSIRIRTRSMLKTLENVVLFPLPDESLQDLVREHENIGINANRSKATDINDLRRLQATLYGSNITNFELLRQARFEATTTLAWLSPKRFGELIVFTRGKIKRYSADRKDAGVRSHHSDIESMGIDPAALASGDKKALVEVAIKSFQRAADAVSGRLRDRREPQPLSTTDVQPSSNQALISPDDRSASPLPDGVNAVFSRMRQLLPVMEANPTSQARLAATSQIALRSCDSCYLKNDCPKYEASASCAFSFPARIESQEDLHAMLSTLLEFQAQRCMFGYFAEQTEGGQLNARTGQEFDRFVKLANQIKELETPVDRGPSIMEQIFGQQELPPGEIDATEEAEDAELVEDGPTESAGPWTPNYEEEGPDGED
jgi:hypothetical protein